MPWTVSVFLLLSELVMVVAKLMSLQCSEHGQDQNVRAPLHAAITFSLSNLPVTELGQQQGIDFWLLKLLEGLLLISTGSSGWP